MADETGIIGPIFKEVLGYGILGIYAVVSTWICFRLYRQLTAVYERLINKRDNRRNQELKVLTELTDLAEDLVRASEALDKAMEHANRSFDNDDRNQRKR